MIGALFRDVLVHLGVFRRSLPIDTVEAFDDFLATRASMIAQKKLYEYVKTRMGISYPRMFQDAPFIESLNIAKWRVYAACLSDLAVWMGAQFHAAGATAEEAAALARHAFGRAIDERFRTGEFTGDADAIVEAFARRLALADWRLLAEGESAFKLSPEQLVYWAPIADELKRYDIDIVLNSLRFAWLAIRQEFRDKFKAEAVLVDWRGRG
ncbi:MAG: hypothetical protein BroJett030_33300 [Alphaproteobacteria bacterium]|nr:MAG: hypothetical protein BroJett030_33300 [Alphaproteobacteria bacterium]